MSRQLNPKQQKLLVEEIEQWRQEALISPELAGTLSARYPGHSTPANVTGVLSIIGAVLVGLGVILFIAANWQHISVAVKLALIFVAIGSSNFFGWRLRFEPGNHPKLGSALLLLGGLLYGAGIWLVAQIFNLETNFTSGTLLWALGVSATAAVTRSVPLGCLATILIGMWNLSRWEHIGSGDFSSMQFPLTMLGILSSASLSWFIRSRAAMWITLLTGTVALMMTLTLSVASMFLWGSLLFGFYLWVKENYNLFSSPFLYVSSITMFGSLLIGTWENHWNLHALNINNLSGLLFYTLAVLLVVAWRTPKVRTECIAVSGIALVTVLTGCTISSSADLAHRVIANILLLATIGLASWTGLNRLKIQGLVNVAIVFFVLDVISRYFDFFFSMMDRSLFFIVGGVLLLVLGATSEASRRRMLKGIAT